MHSFEPAVVRHDGLSLASGLPVGDLRGSGRVCADLALERLALDRMQGLLVPSHPERPLLSLHVEGEVAWVAAYVPGTNVLESSGHTDDGELRVVDFMPLAEGRAGQAEAVPAGRFVRIVTCTEGEVTFRLTCAAAVEAGSGVAARTHQGWHIACSHTLAFADGVATAQVRLQAGESMAFVIALAGVPGGTGLVADTLHGLGDTIHYWTWWSDRCRYRGEGFAERLREALGLKLACVPGGGLLLEHPGRSGFAPAPLGECSRAAAAFLDLGYRQECADLLAHIHAGTGPVDAGHGRGDEWFLPTLARYVDRYGAVALPETLRDITSAALPKARAC